MIGILSNMSATTLNYGQPTSTTDLLFVLRILFIMNYLN
jgi:hypothetical protein